jgi:hypothetical protein
MEILDADDGDLLHEKDVLYDTIDFAFEKRGDTPLKCSPPIAPSDIDKRDAEFMYYDPAGNGTLSRRTIVMPESNLAGPMDKYVHNELGAEGFTKIVWQKQERQKNGKLKNVDMDTSKVVQFKSVNAVSMGTDGLCGCTALVIVSKKGCYMAHFWESISFDSDDFWKTYYGGDEEAFQETVIKGIRDGVKISNKVEQQSLDRHKDLFAGDDTRAYLMVPKTTQLNDAELYKTHYEARWAKMKETVGEIVPVLKNDKNWRTYKYDPVRDEDRQEKELGQKARGTVLLKYDPKDVYKVGKEEKKRKRMVMWMERKEMFDIKWDEK